MSVSGQFSNIAYKMHVYRGNIGYKYSVHLRFTNNNVHLIRLCINGSRHHNEDGTIVGKNHLHSKY